MLAFIVRGAAALTTAVFLSVVLVLPLWFIVFMIGDPPDGTLRWMLVAAVASLTILFYGRRQSRRRDR